VDSVSAAYRIRTERLLQRCWSPADAPRLRESLDASDAHLRPWIPFMKDEPQSLEATVQRLRDHRARFDQDELYRYGVFTPDEETLVGETLLIPRVGPGALEIGYWIDVRQAGNGFATEVAAALVRVAFAVHGVERVEIHCAPENGASAAVPQRLGFRHEATLRRRMRDTTGTPRDLMIWSLLDEELAGSSASSRPLEAFDATGRALDTTLRG